MQPTTISISLNTDSHDFISQQCPSCARRFKLHQDHVQALAHCPYCEHRGTQCWFTKEQAAYIGAIGANAVVLPELEKMVAGFNRRSRDGLIKFSASVNASPTPAPPEESDESLPASTTFVCCDILLHHDAGDVRCPVCGNQ